MQLLMILFGYLYNLCLVSFRRFRLLVIDVNWSDANAMIEPDKVKEAHEAMKTNHVKEANQLKEEWEKQDMRQKRLVACGAAKTLDKSTQTDLPWTLNNSNDPSTVILSTFNNVSNTSTTNCSWNLNVVPPAYDFNAVQLQPIMGAESQTPQLPPQMYSGGPHISSVPSQMYGGGPHTTSVPPQMFAGGLHNSSMPSQIFEEANPEPQVETASSEEDADFALPCTRELTAGPGAGLIQPSMLDENYGLCSICLDRYCDSYIKRCNHGFCSTCLAIIKCGKRKTWVCPVCKVPFSAVGTFL